MTTSREAWIWSAPTGHTDVRWNGHKITFYYNKYNYISSFFFLFFFLTYWSIAPSFHIFELCCRGRGLHFLGLLIYF